MTAVGSQRAARRTLPIVSLLAALALVGCSEPAAPAPPSPPPSAEPIDQPDPEPSPEPEPENLLFTITATVRSIGNEPIDVRVRAFAPVAWDDPEAESMRASFLDVCEEGNGISRIDEAYLSDMGTSLMEVEFSSDNPGLQFASPLELYFGSVYFPRAGLGSALIQPTDAENCYSGYAWVLSEEVTGIASFELPGQDPDLTQWHFGSFGLSVLPESDATIEACAVTMTELASSSGVLNVPGWDPEEAGTPIFCGIGYVA